MRDQVWRFEQARLESVKLGRMKITAKRLEAGYTSHQNGNVQHASLVFSRALTSRQISDQQRGKIEEILSDYRLEARSRLESLSTEVDEIVSKAIKIPSVEPKLPNVGKPESKENPYSTELVGKIRDIGKLERVYHYVPEVNKEIRKAYVRFKEKDRDVADILFEPTVLELIERAQALENQQETCCAYFVYEQAAAFEPSTSAAAARRRADAIRRNPENQRAIDKCRYARELQHEFDTALRFIKRKQFDDGKKKLLALAAEAPNEFAVKKAAREALEQLPQQ